MRTSQASVVIWGSTAEPLRQVPVDGRVPMMERLFTHQIRRVTRVLISQLAAGFPDTAVTF